MQGFFLIGFISIVGTYLIAALAELGDQLFSGGSSHGGDIGSSQSFSRRFDTTQVPKLHASNESEDDSSQLP